ncbi:hypothetical protein AAVH_22115, partial [Aphelenchoides avenae]
FSVKGETFRAWEYSDIDVTTSLITASQDALDAVLRATSAEYDVPSDMYLVDCDKRSSFPDLVFQLPEIGEYRLPAIDYARK